jgi:isopenicillin-N epimerase
MKEMQNPDSKRRKFLKQLFTGSMATLALPGLSMPSAESGLHSPEKFAPAGKDVPDERYWQMVKKQFSVPSNLTMMNAANLCPSPYFVNDLVSSTLQGLSKDVSFQFRHQFSEKRAKALEALSGFVGSSKEEIGIVRNTTEGNTIIVNGLDFKAGDEVILWDQNHPSNNVAWEQRAKRSGFIVKKVTVPAAPKSIDELVAPFAKAITSKTRLLSFSHISNVSGIALPAKELCQLAKSKNVLSLVDGAQSLGVVDLNLKNLGCDFYTGSTHKWLMGPFENGILYVNRERLSQIWPNVISAGWKDGTVTVDEKLCVLGQRNETTPFALPEIVEFHNSVGRKNIEDRVRQLSSYVKSQVQSKIPQAEFISPIAPELSAGIVVINIPGKQPQDIYQKLYANHGIACAATVGVRLSPHIYNSMEDMDRVVDAVKALSM